MRSLRPVLFVALSAWCTILPGQDRRFTPIEVPAGPLVCICVSDPDAPRITRVCLADLGGVGPAREFLRTSEGCTVLHRLDRTHLLLHVGDSLVVVDAELGRVRRLGAVSWMGDEIRRAFFLVRGDEIVHRDGGLLASSWRTDAQPRRLGPQACTRVEQQHGDFVLVTAGAELLRIDLVSGESKSLVPASSNLSWSSARLSPSGRFVALGQTIRPNCTGQLQVVDLHDGSVVQEWKGIHLGVTPSTSYRPQLEFAWVDDRVLAYFEWHSVEESAEGPIQHRQRRGLVRRRVLDGEVLSPEVHTGSALFHDQSLGESPRQVVDRWFFEAPRADGTTGKLLRTGRAAPLHAGGGQASSILEPGWEHWSVAISDGTDCAVVWANDSVLLFQKPSDEPRHLAHGTEVGWPFCRSTAWLPAAD